jgi:hypothetical protein
MAAANLDAQPGPISRRRGPTTTRADDPELDQFMVRCTYYIRTRGGGAARRWSDRSIDSSHAILLLFVHACMHGIYPSSNMLCLPLRTAGGLLQHAGEVPRGDGAADPGGNGVLQQHGEAARLDDLR